MNGIDSRTTTGTVREILISKNKGGPMASLHEVQAFAGRGLVGDRNFSTNGMPTLNNITLIEAEKVQEFCQATGLEFSPADTRRNIITSGIELNALVGHEFYLGPVKVRALELCEPCSLLARRTNRAVLWGLLHKGGLRCQIVTDGLIKLGDPVKQLEERI